MPEADPLLRSMVIQGTHAALSSIRADETGSFAGLAAGQAYSAPARTYFRDGYWTLQPLLTLAPEAVRDQLSILARGVQPDGEAPSGVILSGAAQSAAWRAFRDHPDRYKEHHLRPGDWWSDHFDSPLFFVLALGDYVRATGDEAEAERHWPVVRAIIERYFRLSGPHGLPLKPRTDRDWADNVYREGLVSYDLGLWVGALDTAIRLGSRRDPDLAERARATAAHARRTIDGLLWVEQWQGYADYRTPDGFIEDHLVMDALTLLRYNAVPEAKARRFLDAIERTLESRNNRAQPYGDWGMLCAFPPYKRARDIRAKTAFAFRYHNGSDWPYWDGAYAEERLRRGLGGARYPLTRWWEYCLEQGWAGAVEYFSPPFGRGSLLQGWSGLPAAVAVKYGLAALADEEPELRREATR
jgi:glycogen debranching enzyme